MINIWTSLHFLYSWITYIFMIKYLTTKLLQPILQNVYSDLWNTTNDWCFSYNGMIASVTVIICFGLQHFFIDGFPINDFCNNAFLNLWKCLNAFELLKVMDNIATKRRLWPVFGYTILSVFLIHLCLFSESGLIIHSNYCIWICALMYIWADSHP